VDPTFTELYRHHYPAVLRFARRRAQEADVDDIVSETFMAAWRRQDEMAAAPLPWLYRTARNVILNTNRAAGRRDGLAVRIASMSGDAQGADDPIAWFEQRQDISRLWQGLDPLDQEILALQIWEGLSGREAAAVLGISRAACSMRATRARRRLATALESAGPGGPGYRDPRLSLIDQEARS
jgi:RNA polymerase sigma factor (sigma-70 family)